MKIKLLRSGRKHLPFFVLALANEDVNNLDAIHKKIGTYDSLNGKLRIRKIDVDKLKLYARTDSVERLIVRMKEVSSDETHIIYNV